MPSLQLASTDGGNLTITRDEPPESPWWRVSLEMPGLSASIDFDADVATYSPALAAFFASLAADWRGWTGPRTWNAIDNTLTFSATHDGLGHVALRVQLAHKASLDTWKATATIKTDAGQLDAIARDVAHFAGPPTPA